MSLKNRREENGFWTAMKILNKGLIGGRLNYFSEAA